MALILADRVKETSTTTGTGTLSLAGAVSGFQGFVAGIGHANTCYYAIVHQGAAEWEVGMGTVTDAAPDTLARTTVLASNNAGAAVNFSAGTKDVFVTLPATIAAEYDYLWRTRRDAYHVKTAGANAALTVGQTAPVGTGTSAAVGDADGDWLDITTTTTLGNTVGYITAFTVMRRDWEPEMVLRIKTPADITSLGYWLGLFSASPDNAADPAIHLAAFRYYTSTDGTAFWRCATKDGTTINVTTTTVAITVNTPYTLRVDCRVAANVKFYINGTLVATHTANLPTATTLLGWGVRVTTLVAAARKIMYSRTWLSAK